MILIRLIINKALSDIYDFQISFNSANNIFALLKAKKSISKIIAILILASIKVF